MPFYLSLKIKQCIFLSFTTKASFSIFASLNGALNIFTFTIPSSSQLFVLNHIVKTEANAFV